MSIEQCQRTVNSLDKDIADLEEKKAAKDKEVANLQAKINSLQKSITKHTSSTTLNSKLRQISSYESDKARKTDNTNKRRYDSRVRTIPHPFRFSCGIPQGFRPRIF